MIASFLRRSLLVAAVCGISAAVLPPLSARAATTTLRGSVTYRERMALPPAVLEVRLLEASAADGNAPVLARTSMRTNRQVPIPFTLHFNRGLLKAGHSYVLDATLFVAGHPWFVTTRQVLVPEGSKAAIQIVLSRATDHDTTGATATPAASLTGTWQAERLGDAPVAEGSRPPLLSLAEDGTVSGFSGCNRVRGKARIENAALTFGPLMTTRMACAPQAMTTEQLFLKNLDATRGWHLAPTGDVLALVDAQDKPTVTFRRQPAENRDAPPAAH